MVKKVLNYIWLLIVTLFLFGMFMGTLRKGYVNNSFRNICSLKEFTDSFEDNLFAKQTLLNKDEDIAHLLYDANAVRSNKTIAGRDGWLFYKESINNYLGNVTLSEEQIDLIIKQVTAECAFFEDKGCEYIFLIAPDKEQVYYEKMPDYYLKNERNIGPVVYHSLQNSTDVSIVYPLAELQAHKDMSRLYYQTDSHWNTVGAYVGVEAALDQLDYEIIPLESMKIEKVEFSPSTCAYGDLRELANVQKYYEEDGQFQIDELNSAMGIVAEKEYENVSEGLIVNEDAKYDKTVLLIGDSFRIAMLPALCENYRNVYQIHDWIYDEDEILEKVQPDIVIREYVERHFME